MRAELSKDSLCLQATATIHKSISALLVTILHNCLYRWLADACPSPVQHHTLSRGDRCRAYVVAELDRVFSRGHGDRLVDLSRRKLGAGGIEHGVVIRTSGFQRQGP